MATRIIVHDVGHGQAVHVFTPAGETIVIDLGCSEGFSPLEWLREITETIDLLIITHPHGDHIDEMPLVDSLKFDVRQFWGPRWLPRDTVEKQNQESFSENVDAYFEMCNTYNATIEQDKLVGNPQVSGGASIKILSSNSCGTSNINNHSGVVVIDYATSTVVIPGDNEPSSWRSLNKLPEFVEAMKRVDIFMASHHGRISGNL